MTPEDDGAHRRASDPVAPIGFGNKISAGSLGSISSDASSGPSSIQLAIRNKHLSYDGGSSVDSDTLDSGGLYNPPTPARSSSHKVVISHLANLDQRSSSVDSLSRLSDSSASRRDRDSRQQDRLSHVRSSHEDLTGKHQRTCGSNDNLSNLRHSKENLQHSSDNLLGQSNGGQSAFCVTTGQLPRTSTYSPPPPYTRSHTTSALINPSMSSVIMPEPSHPVSAAPISTRKPVSHGLHIEAGNSRPVGVGHQRYADRDSRGYSGSRYHDNVYPSQPMSTADPKYGATFTVHFHEASGANRQQVPKYPQAHDRVPMSASVTITAGRPSSGDQTQNINLVTERLKKYTGYGNGESITPADISSYRGAMIV